MVDKTVKTGQNIAHMVIIFQRDCNSCFVFWILWNQLCYTSSKPWRLLYWKFHTYTVCNVWGKHGWMESWRVRSTLPRPTLYTVLGYHPVGALELPCTQQKVTMCLFYLHMPVMLYFIHCLSPLFTISFPWTPQLVQVSISHPVMIDIAVFRMVLS